jgi:hypothetical protein
MTSVIHVPEGHATVAQRFNAGFRCRSWRVPKGRSPVNRPFGTQGCPTAVPALKRGAILVSSLWDEGAQILVAVGEDTHRERLPRTSSRFAPMNPFTRATGTLSPSEGEREGVRGPFSLPSGSWKGWRFAN